MKFYFYTSGKISKAQFDTFWAELRAVYPTAYYSPYDVSNGAPVGDEDGFAVYGPAKDWAETLANLAETNKPVYFKDLT